MSSVDRYIKDPISGALLNTDYASYEKLLHERNKYKKQLEKDLELDKLRNEMAQLKEMLQVVGINV